MLCKASSKGELGHKPIRVPCQQDLLHGLSRERSARFIGFRGLGPSLFSKSASVHPKDCCEQSCEHGLQLDARVWTTRNTLLELPWNAALEVSEPSSQAPRLSIPNSNHITASKPRRAQAIAHSFSISYHGRPPVNPLCLKLCHHRMAEDFLRQLLVPCVQSSMFSKVLSSGSCGFLQHVHFSTTLPTAHPTPQVRQDEE